MKVISVIGPSKADPELKEVAEQLGREIAQKDFAVLCGGMGGVMESVCRGAKSAGGLTIGILPGETMHGANSYLDIPIITGIGQARNLTVALSGNVIIAIGGGFGTLSEISLALKFNKIVIGINTWEVSPEIHSVFSAAEAVKLAAEYLNNRKTEKEHK